MQIPKQAPEWFKPGAWGAVIGIAAAVIIGFGAGWVVTSSSAQETAEVRAEQAVLASLTPICVAQFKSQSNPMAEQKLAALEEEDSWQRGDYIAKQGWATMPGSEKPNDEVATACVDQLMKIADKSQN